MDDNTQSSEVISIASIIRKLWDYRGLIVAIPLLTMLAAVIYIATNTLQVSRNVVYFVELKGVENGAYPNGTTFSPRDLVSGEVLTRLRGQLKLPASANLRRAISVTYDSPVAPGLRRAYLDRLSNRNLGQAEIAAINQEFEQTMRTAVRSTLRIDVNYSELGLDASTGIAVANALPEIWSNVFSTQFRVLNDTRLASGAISRTREDLSDIASLLVAHRKVQSMEKGLGIVAADNRLSMVQTAAGLTAEDIRLNLQRFRTVWFNALLAAGMKSDTPVGDAYLRDLQLQIAEYEARDGAYENSLRQLQDFQRPNTGTSGTEQTSVDGRPSGIQLSDSGLAEIVNLTRSASLAAAVESLVRDRLSNAFEAASLKRELATLDRDIAGSSAPAFRERTAEELNVLSSSYMELVERAQARLSEQLGELFLPAVPPMVAGSLINLPVLIFVFLAGALGVFLSLIIVVVRSVLTTGGSTPIARS